MENNDLEKIVEAAEGLCQPVDYNKIAQNREDKQLPGLADYKASLRVDSVRGEAVYFEDGTVVEPPGSISAARQEIEALENLQIKRRKQYEADRTFFEQQVLKKSRSVGEIQEDYIKILHPHYREKFLAGLEKYGTIAAALKYMKDTHGLKVRSDVLNRISMMVPAFKTEIDDALAMYQASIQMEIHRRAVEGTEKGIYYNGEQVATEKVYSDSLLAKLADTHNPEYKEAKQKEGSRGNIINVQIIKDFHNYKETK